MYIEPETPETYGTYAPDAFYPDIDIDDFVKTTRTGNGTVTPARYLASLEYAFMIVEENIADKRCQWQTEGYTRLIDVPSQALAAETFLVKYWRQAIYARAAAYLLKTHSDITPAHDAISLETNIHPQIGQYQRIANEAERKINNLSRINCELI